MFSLKPGLLFFLIFLLVLNNIRNEKLLLYLCILMCLSIINVYFLPLEYIIFILVPHMLVIRYYVKNKLKIKNN